MRPSPHSEGIPRTQQRMGLSFIFRRKLGQQVRPVAGHDATYFVIDGSDDLKAFLDLPADYFKFLRAERATVQEFHRHGNLTGELGPSFHVGAARPIGSPSITLRFVPVPYG